MALVDHPAKVRAANRIITVAGFYCGNNFPLERRTDITVNKYMVRGDTGLPGVHHFAGENTFGGQFQVGITVDDGWAFAA